MCFFVSSFDSIKTKFHLFPCFLKASSFAACQKSILTVRYGNHCPKDAASWHKRANNLNCNSIRQQCSESVGLDPKKYIFQYHCLINSWMNATIEVCALNQSILGKYLPFYILKNWWCKLLKKINLSNCTSISSYEGCSPSQIPVFILFAYFIQTNTHLKAKTGDIL